MPNSRSVAFLVIGLQPKGVTGMLNNRFSFIALLALLVALTVATGCSPQQEDLAASSR